MLAFTLCVLLLTGGGAPAGAAEAERAAPLAPEARGAILDLSLALSRQGIAGPELSGFSGLSASLNLSREPVSDAQLAAYARMAGELARRSAAAKEPAETAAALKLVSDALAPRLDAPARQALEQARESLLAAGGTALMARARGIGDALAEVKPAQALPQGPALRPAVEWWTLGERRYEDTAQLLRDWKPRPGEQVPAVYHFRRSGSETPTRTLAAPSRAALGAAMGFLVGAILLGTLTLQATYLSPLFIMLFSTLIGAALGPASGLASKVWTARQEKTISGWAADVKGRVLFVIDGSAAAPVDLARHAGARISIAPGFAGQGSDGFNGAVMMLAASLATLTPHALGVLVSGGVACLIHAPLDHGKAVPFRAALAGIVLMLIQLAEVTVASGHGWSGLHTLSLIWGAIWGLTMLPRLRAAKSSAAVENGQWWAAAPAKPAETE